MKYRKFWYFKNSKSIHIELAGWKQNPSIYLQVDGDERELIFHISLFIGIWIIFSRFLPNKWYPTYETKTYGDLPTEKEISFRIHGGSFWWTLWKDDDEGFHKSWRKGAFHYKDFIIGKTDCSHKEINYEDYVLPYYEGNYGVRVIESRWTWKMRRRFFWFLDIKNALRYEVKAGYQDGGVFIEKPIPKEGKGENSWDCGEDATYSCSFGINKLKSKRDAALEFWKSTMKERIRHGGKKWLPKDSGWAAAGRRLG